MFPQDSGIVPYSMGQFIINVRPSEIRLSRDGLSDSYSGIVLVRERGNHTKHSKKLWKSTKIVNFHNFCGPSGET